MTKEDFRDKVLSEYRTLYGEDVSLHPANTAPSRRKAILKLVDEYYEVTGGKGSIESSSHSRIHFTATELREMFQDTNNLSTTVEKNEAQPPKSALFLMYVFYRREQREGLLGDMEQDFQEAVELFGVRKAIWLCWMGVFASLGPSILAWLARGAVFSKVVEFFHKFVG